MEQKQVYFNRGEVEKGETTDACNEEYNHSGSTIGCFIHSFIFLFNSLSLFLMNHFYFCAVNFLFLSSVQTTVNATHLEQPLLIVVM